MNADTFAALAFLALCAVVSLLAGVSLRRSRRIADREALARSVGVLRDPDLLAPWRDREPGMLPEQRDRGTSS